MRIIYILFTVGGDPSETKIVYVLKDNSSNKLHVIADNKKYRLFMRKRIKAIYHLMIE